MGEATVRKSRQLEMPLLGKADWRQFRCLELENEVTVCLVHDKESKTTAAAATVKVGAASDPRSYPGIAHFCEHMCFLGSEKYPGENEYKKYLSQHGGSSNASTSLHLTTYKFEVLAAHAEKAIDIFSHFFVAPLFTKSGTGREVNAVDSENSKNLTADARRRLQILKDLCDHEHYFSKFTTGNSRTLPTNNEKDLEHIRELLLAFHRKHYRPENLTVVVAGPQSLDELEEWVVPRFGTMQAKPFPEKENDMTQAEKLVESSALDAPPYGFQDSDVPFESPLRPELQKQWPVLVTINPVQSMRRLVLLFPLPSVHKNPDRAPTSLLAHLLGHEGPHSPFALLQNEGLITSLSAGNRFSEPPFSLFQLDISLTEKGEQRWKDVVDVILQYARFLHDEAVRARIQGGTSSPLIRIWEEKIALSKIFFDQTSPGAVDSLCPNLCSSIVAYGTGQCMSAGFLLNEDVKTIPLHEFEHFTSLLVASNCIIERNSKEAWEEIQKSESKLQHQLKREQWYDIEYYLSELDESDISRWNSAAVHFLDASHLALPEPNPYIPKSLELCPELPEEAKAGPRIDKPIDPPNLVLNDPVLGRLWHRLDDRYALPKASLSLFLANAEVEHTKTNGLWMHDPKKVAMSSLMANMFNQALAQDTYDASLAGLSWSLSLGGGGICLICDGFSDRLSDLGLEVLKHFLKKDFIIEAHFTGAKDGLLRGLRTFFESRRADAHAAYYRNLVLDSSADDIESSLLASETLVLQDIVDHHSAVIQNSEVSLDCLMCGNVSERNSRAFFESATRILRDARHGQPLADANMWIPGPTENRLAPLDEIELHFASQNPHEENGSLVVSYQSPLPAFRGEHLSSVESLKSSATIRLLCQILREPFFDELRTKQALGYIVHSYFDIAVSLRPSSLSHLGPLCVQVDFITISILSRKIAPPELKIRVDDFLAEFRKVLVAMPDSEISSHASALSTNLLKPIRTLGAEVSNHFTRIRRYSPEICFSGGRGNDLPWKNAEVMAAQVRKLDRVDLLAVWDKVVMPANRSRVVSMVYGSSFPLQPLTGKPNPQIINRIPDILSFRKHLLPYDNTPSQSRKLSNHIFQQWLSNRSVAAIAAASVFGVGFIGWTLMARSKKRTM